MKPILELDFTLSEFTLRAASDMGPARSPYVQLTSVLLLTLVVTGCYTPEAKKAYQDNQRGIPVHYLDSQNNRAYFEELWETTSGTPGAAVEERVIDIAIKTCNDLHKNLVVLDLSCKDGAKHWSAYWELFDARRMHAKANIQFRCDEPPAGQQASQPPPPPRACYPPSGQ